MVHISESEGIEDRIFVVTGGAGFVGTKLCLELIRRGAREVRCFDIESSQSRLSYLRSNGVNCITGDVRHKEEVARAFKGVNCVFHLASYGISGKETLQARRIDEVNLDGTCNVLQSCIKCGVERLIYTSSYDVVFGGQEILNGNESLAYVPLMDHISSYGRSKALAEQLVLKNNGQPLRGQKGRSLYTCAVRPAIVYGPGEQRLIPRIIKHARSGLFLFKIGASNVRTDWLYVDNFVQAQLLASMALLDDIPGRGGNVPAAGQTYFISDAWIPTTASLFSGQNLSSKQ